MLLALSALAMLSVTLYIIPRFAYQICLPFRLDKSIDVITAEGSQRIGVKVKLNISSITVRISGCFNAKLGARLVIQPARGTSALFPEFLKITS